MKPSLKRSYIEIKYLSGDFVEIMFVSSNRGGIGAVDSYSIEKSK